MASVVSQQGRSEPSFWSILAQKAKALVEDDSLVANDSPGRAKSETRKGESPVKEQSPVAKPSPPPARQVTMGRPLQKGLEVIASSLSSLGDTLGTAFEEGLNLMDGKSSIKLSPVKTESPEVSKPLQRSPSIWKKVEGVQARQPAPIAEEIGQAELQLRASRDVAMAMATKAKGLLRELKTADAEISFLKNRCGQLEEENKQLREGAFQGDDFVRKQLESLLAEKQRLAQENANYARENQLLHEVVEYHQLTLQDVAFLVVRSAADTEDFITDLNEDPIDDSLNLK